MIKRILVTATTFPIFEGDTSPRFVLDLTKAIQAIGKYECRVLVPHWPQSKCREILEGVQIYRFRYAIPEQYESISGQGIIARIKEKKARLLLVPLLLLSQLYVTYRQMVAFKPDVLMAHWIIPQGLVAAIIKKARPNCRVLIISHGGDAALISRNAILQKLTAWIFDTVDEVVAVSSFIQAKLYEGLPGYSGNIHVIPMGVDVTRFKNGGEANSTCDRSGIIFVGRLEEKKGVSYLLHAFLRLLDERPREKLTIIGDGTYKNELILLSEKLGIKDNVIFTGPITQEKIAILLQKNAVAVIPSINLNDDVEGMPTVITEFAAMKIPIIATNAGGITDFIKDGETGLLARQKDPDDLYRLIRILSKDEALQKKLAENAYELMLKSFSYCSVGSRYSKLLKL